MKSQVSIVYRHFGDSENGDPPRTNLGRGEYLVDEPERRFFASMEVVQIHTFSMS